MKKPNTSTITKVTLATTTILLALVVVKLNTPPKHRYLMRHQKHILRLLKTIKLAGFLEMRRLCSQPHQTTLRNSILTLET